MKKVQGTGKKKGIVVPIIQIFTLITGGVFLLLKKNKISAFFKKQNIVIASIYGILISMIAVILRLITYVVWLLQQAGPR